MVLGILIGALVSIVLGFAYIVALHEPGSAFYPFAALAFLGGPLLGGIVAGSRAQDQRFKAFFATSVVVFAIVWMAFIFTYVVLPQFARRNVQLPAFCAGWDGRFIPPAQLAYTLPGAGTGVLLTSDAQSAVMVMIDPTQPPFPSSVYLINKSDNKMIRGMGFNNDVVSATI